MSFVVEHSLRPTASVQCEGDNAVSCGRKAATEEHTAAAAAEQTPGKTVDIATGASMSTDFPLRAERNRKIVIPPPQAPAERQTSGRL